MKNWITCCLIALSWLPACAVETATAGELRQREQMARDRESLQKQHAAIDGMQRDQESIRKQRAKECGADFGVPRVGMTLDRAKTCLGYARLVGQVNRKDGVASVYTNGRVQLIVMNDKVVAWQATR